MPVVNHLLPLGEERPKGRLVSDPKADSRVPSLDQLMLIRESIETNPLYETNPLSAVLDIAQIGGHETARSMQVSLQRVLRKIPAPKSQAPGIHSSWEGDGAPQPQPPKPQQPQTGGSLGRNEAEEREVMLKAQAKAVEVAEAASMKAAQAMEEAAAKARAVFMTDVKEAMVEVTSAITNVLSTIDAKGKLEEAERAQREAAEKAE